MKHLEPETHDFMPIRHSDYEYRLLNIMVERFQRRDESFTLYVPDALREYADALERDNNRERAADGENEADDDCKRFHSKNGCEIKVIAGGYAFRE